MAGKTHLLGDPEVMNPFLATGEIPPVGMNGAAYRAFIAAEQLRWGEVVRRSGLKVD